MKGIVLALLLLILVTVVESIDGNRKNSNNDYDDGPIKLLNLVQNSPGDPLGVQQTRFTDPHYLRHLGFTGDVSTGELSPGLVVDFSSLGIDIWSVGSAERMWAEAHKQHLQDWLTERKDAGLAAFFWIDMVVFPKALLYHFEDQIMTDFQIDFRKNKTKELLSVYFEEMFDQFPDIDGVFVRTGETYVQDTPYHSGNSPLAFTLSVPEQDDLWVDFLSMLREHVSERANKYVFFRTWDSFDGWQSERDRYVNITDRVAPHPKFGISCKQQAGDYFRYARFNPQIGAGHHSQVIEISAQRGWEGKGAYPNYHIDQLITGYQELPSDDRVGLNRFAKNHSIVRGIWIWSRGDGWYGPYLKGNELWPSLMSQTLAKYWLSNGTMTEEDAFVSSCRGTYNDLKVRDCETLRLAGQLGAEATIYMRYCPEIAVVGDACWFGYRDDRLGGMNQHGGYLDIIRSRGLVDTAILNRQRAVALMEQAHTLLESICPPSLPNRKLARFLKAHGEYGVRHFKVIEASWRVMLHGLEYRANRTLTNRELILNAIHDYDKEHAGYQTLVLLAESPSLFWDYWFNLPGDPPPEGIGATVEYFKKLLVEDYQGLARQVSVQL